VIYAGWMDGYGNLVFISITDAASRRAMRTSPASRSPTDKPSPRGRWSATSAVPVTASGPTSTSRCAWTGHPSIRSVTS